MQPPRITRPTEEQIAQAMERAERFIRDKLTAREGQRRKQTDVGGSLYVIGLPYAADHDLDRRDEWFHIGMVVETRANEGHEVWLDPVTMRVQTRRERM